MILLLTAGFMASLNTSAHAADFYVALNGDDNDSGSQSAPFRTVLRGLSAMVPGDTTFIMPGDYSTGSRLTIEDFHGAADNLLHLVAFDNLDKPRFRSGVMIRRTSYVHFKGFDVSQTIIRVDGLEAHHNTFENFDVHHVSDAMGMSFQNQTNNNRVINSDFHHNILFANSNADGLVFWGASNGTNGPFDNYVYGCRAYFNNDDGFDTWWSNGETIFENCWSFGNGKDDNFNDIPGDGNGYKLGQGSNNYPTLINCLAWKNKTRGFDENGNQAGGITIYNSTGWANDVRNFGFFSAPNTDVIRNCVSFEGGGASTPENYATADHNSWDLGLLVTSADFISLDFSANMGPRKSDGSLPDSDFLRLKNSSQLVDQGITLGLPFQGMAPDLGAYEVNQVASGVDGVVQAAQAAQAVLGQNVPNPFNPLTQISFSLAQAGQVRLAVYDLRGRLITTLLQSWQEAGDHVARWDGTDEGGRAVSAGIYLYRLEMGNYRETRQMVLVK